MSDLTDNEFYPSAEINMVVYALEQHWEILPQNDLHYVQTGIFIK